MVHRRSYIISSRSNHLLQGLGFGVLGFRVYGLGCRVQGTTHRIMGLRVPFKATVGFYDRVTSRYLRSKGR